MTTSKSKVKNGKIFGRWKFGGALVVVVVVIGGGVDAVARLTTPDTEKKVCILLIGPF